MIGSHVRSGVGTHQKSYHFVAVTPWAHTLAVSVMTMMISLYTVSVTRGMAAVSEHMASPGRV